MSNLSQVPRTGGKPNFASPAVGIACGLALAWTALFLGLMPFVRSMAGSRDFVVYWATGQQLIHHANPFDPVAMGALERGAGYAGKAGSYYMRNPPWCLPLALPLGLVGARFAALPWSLMVFGLLVLAVRIHTKILDKTPEILWWLGCAFPPALSCVIMGQTSVFLLLGMVLFLRLYRTRPYLGGASLWFCTLKPHVLLPFAVVLLAWIAFSRNYKVLAGAIAALAFSCALALCIDPAAFAQYARWAAHSGISHEFIPCLAVGLRDMINPAAGWIVFLPAIPACAWALLYFWRNRRAWNWLEHGQLLVLVSLLVAPYCWFYDQSLALPAVLTTAYRLNARGGALARAALLTLAGMYLLLTAQPLYAGALNSRFYLWPAAGWLLWYLWARHVLATAPAFEKENSASEFTPSLPA